MHLIVDGFANNVDIMTNKDLMVYELKRLVGIIGMTPVGEPYSIGFPWPDAENEDAISAVCFLKESAVIVHCYPEAKFVFVDVFSCRDFNTGNAYGHIKQMFDMPAASPVLLNRGLDERGFPIPASIDRERRIK